MQTHVHLCQRVSTLKAHVQRTRTQARGLQRHCQPHPLFAPQASVRGPLQAWSWLQVLLSGGHSNRMYVFVPGSAGGPRTINQRTVNLVLHTVALRAKASRATDIIAPAAMQRLNHSSCPATAAARSTSSRGAPVARMHALHIVAVWKENVTCLHAVLPHEPAHEPRLSGAASCLWSSASCHLCITIHYYTATAMC